MTTNPLQLPFDFPPNSQPTTQELQANFSALLDFVQNLNDGLQSLTTLLVSTLQTTSTAVIGGDLTASTKIKLADGSAAAPSLTLINATTTGLFKGGTSTLAAATAGVKAWQADSSGNITQPIQPAFEYRKGAVPVNKTGGADPLDFPSKQYDTGNNFNTSTNLFTAPVAGKYLFFVAVDAVPRAGVPASFFKVGLVTTGVTYSIYNDNPSSATEQQIPFTVLVDMAAGDTAKVTMSVAGGTTTWTYCNTAASIFGGTLIN